MFLKIFLLVLFGYITICAATTIYKIGLLNEDSFMTDMELRVPKINSKLHPNIKLSPWTEHVKSMDAFSTLNLTCHMLDNDVVTIFGPVSRRKLEIIENICSAKQIPQILTSFVGPIKETQINFYPNIELLTEAYIDILSSINWEKFTMLYVSSNVKNDVIRATKIISDAQQANFEVDFESVDVYDDLRDRNILEELKKRNQKFFVIDCHQEHITPILQHFQSYGMVTDGYNFFFTNIVVDNYSLDLEDFSHSGANFIMIKLFKSNISNLLDNKDLPHFKYISEALTLDALEMLSQSLHSLKPVLNVDFNCKNTKSWYAGSQLINLMLTSSYHGVTGSISFGPDRYRNNFDLYIDKVSDGNLEEIGMWNRMNRFTSTIQKPIENHLQKTLTVVAVLTEPYVMMKPSISPNLVYQGFAIDLIKQLSYELNFNYTIKITTNGVNDALQQVKDGRADLAVGDITITYDRLDIVDFTSPIMQTGISILFQKPLLVSNAFQFAQPFSRDIWVAMLVAIVGVTISLFIVGRLSSNEWKRLHKKSDSVISELTFLNVLWFVSGSLFRQNTDITIRSVPGRIIAASWWLLSFIMIATYIAALVGRRQIPDVVRLFNDVESLVKNAEKYDIKFGALRNGATVNFFKNSHNPLYQNIYQYMEANPDNMVNTIHDGVQLALSSRYAFFTEDSFIDYTTSRHCNLGKYGGPLSSSSYGIAISKASPYRSALSRTILMLSTMGKLDALRQIWWEEMNGGGACHIDEDFDEVVTSFSVSDMADVVFITFVGAALALICAVIEFLYYVNTMSNKHQTTFWKTFQHEIKSAFKNDTRKIGNCNLIITPRGQPATELHELS